MTRWLAALAGIALVACASHDADSGDAASPVPLEALDFASLAQAAVRVLGAVVPDRDFEDQDSIPLQVTGYDGQVPSRLFGKPVEASMNFRKSAKPMPGKVTAVYIHLLERAGGKIRVRAGQCWGLGSREGEAWFQRDGQDWTSTEVLWSRARL